MDAPVCQGCMPLIEQLRAEVAQLRAELAAAKKNSTTSSKPPSSDIVKPPRPKSSKKRKRGGQPGHDRHERACFDTDQIDDSVNYTLSACPDCGGHLKLSSEPSRIIQQVELVAKPTQ